MAQFKTTRMSDATPAKNIDDQVNDLESAIKFLLGLSGADLDAELQAAFADLDVHGRVNGRIRFRGGPDGAGISIRDTTNSTEFFISAGSDGLHIHKNVGTEDSPSWALVNTLYLEGGGWGIPTQSIVVGMLSPTGTAGQVLAMNDAEDAVLFRSIVAAMLSPDGVAGQALSMNDAADAVEFRNVPALSLNPGGGSAGQVLKVNSTATAMEFGTVDVADSAFWMAVDTSLNEVTSTGYTNYKHVVVPNLHDYSYIVVAAASVVGPLEVRIRFFNDINGLIVGYDDVLVNSAGGGQIEYSNSIPIHGSADYAMIYIRSSTGAAASYGSLSVKIIP